MDFVGTGNRLSQGDIGEAARWLGIPTAALLAFIEVETAGRGFDSQNRPKMLFEPHVFWRELGAGTARDLAAKLGVAYAKWGAKPYPKDSYPRLKTAQTVHAAKALRSSSWGLGQILSDKHQICGHSSEEAFVRANMQGEREQLLCMTALMIAWGVPKMLAGKDLSKPDSWRGPAAKWNGSGYAKHNYHGRIAAAFVKHDKGLDEQGAPLPPKIVVSVGAVLLEKGMKGEAVRNLQADLAALGYEFKHGIDGRFGDETDAIVREFQRAWGITVDGKVGPETQKAIDATLAGAKASGDAFAQPPVVHPEQTTQPQRAPIWLIVLVLIALAVAAFVSFLTGAHNVR
jgi:hypothetical protein